MLPNQDYNGEVGLTYTVSDGTVTVDASNTVNITAVNDSPVATFTTAQAFNEDDATITGTLTASDVDSTALSFSLNGFPIDGLTIDSATGNWSFDPTHDSYQGLKQDETLEINVNYSVTCLLYTSDAADE